MGHENDILDLILSSAGKAAPYMTEKLSKIGDGSMAEGISALADFCSKSGMEIGEKVGLKTGAFLGIVGTLTILGTTKVILNFRQKRAARIAALQEMDNRMKISDTGSKFSQADEESPCCDANDEHKDEVAEE